MLNILDSQEQSMRRLANPEVINERGDHRKTAADNIRSVIEWQFGGELKQYGDPVSESAGLIPVEKFSQIGDLATQTGLSNIDLSRKLAAQAHDEQGVQDFLGEISVPETV
ncbi:MAG: hypothetical protein WCJ24_00155 [Candidatus Saccharibacteria bacterium]